MKDLFFRIFVDAVGKDLGITLELYLKYILLIFKPICETSCD